MDERTSVEAAARVSRMVHLSMGFMAEVLLPLVVGLLAGNAISFVEGGDAVPPVVISVTAIASAVLASAISHRMVCSVIKSSAPCALGTIGRLATVAWPRKRKDPK